MSQPASDLPRFVQIIGRYRTLVGVMATLGLLAGAVFAALNPPVFTSQALILFTPSCPAGAICGGPLFVSDDIGSRLLPPLPSGVQVEPLAGNVQSVSATAGTAAQAEAAANAAARSYLIYYDALIYSNGGTSAPVLHPATRATGTAPLIRLRDDALLGAVLGALLGVIAALAGGAATIDTPAAPPGFDVGEGRGPDRPETSYASTGVPLGQLAPDYRRLPIASLTLPFARDRSIGARQVLFAAGQGPLSTRRHRPCPSRGSSSPRRLSTTVAGRSRYTSRRIRPRQSCSPVTAS